MNNLALIFSITVLLVAGWAVYLHFQNIKLTKTLKESHAEMSRKIYELAILKELGERTGYSLNVEKIADIITGSLGQFIKYSAVAYALLEPEKTILKIHLEKSVSRNFINDVEDRMLSSLSALLGTKIAKTQVSEILTGAIVVDEVKDPVRSFFNIPLVIGEKVVGVLTIAHTSPGLYKEEEMTILYKITRQASNAVTKLQEVVQIEQRKLNSMVESMAEGVIMTDKDYHVVVANPAAKNIIGVSKPEVSIFDFIDKLGGSFDIRGKLEESVQLDKLLISDEIKIDGHFYQTIVSPVKSSIGERKETLGGVVIFHDITKEKEAERMREDFTSMMVHELRSPLDGVKKIVELLRTSGSKLGKKEQKEYFQIIYGSSSQMLELVNDLLDVAKLESGRFEIEKALSKIEQTIKDRVRFFDTVAQDKKININIEIQKDLPDILFDNIRVGQVLNNLLSNAIKFTGAGGNVAVRALLHKKGADVKKEFSSAGIGYPFFKAVPLLDLIPDSLVVSVSDTGAGIPKDKIDYLFNKYRQFRATAESEIKGTGLGLAICKGIIEAHGGGIFVDTSTNVGSNFYFNIPINAKEIPPLAAASLGVNFLAKGNSYAKSTNS